MMDDPVLSPDLLLHHLTNIIHDIGIGQGGDIADISFIGNSAQNPAHDLSGTRLGHVLDDPNLARFGDFADLVADGIRNLFGQFGRRLKARFEGHIQVS